MGAYDDLIPKGGAGTSGGTYADLIPKVAQPRPAQQNPIDRTIKRGVTQGLRNLGDFGAWASQNPLARGVGAVLGATERAGESGASWALDRLAGKKPTTNPVAGVMDPEGDIRVTHRLESQEASLLDRYVPGLREAREHNAQLPQLNSGLAQAVLDFQTQTLHDPQSYIPAWDIFSLAARAARMAGAGRAARAGARAVGSILPEAVKKTASRAKDAVLRDLTTSHEPLKGAQQSGLNVIRSREGGARHLRAQREAQYGGIAAHEPGLTALGQTMAAKNLTGSKLRNVHTVINEIPLEQRLALHKANKLTDAALWRDASPEARRQMRARGYVPPVGEEHSPVTNLVQADFGRRYVPEQTLYDQAAADEASTARGHSYDRGGVKRSKYDAPKHGASQDLGPLYERFEKRLHDSAYLEPKRRAEQNIIRDLGLTPTQAPRTDARITELQERLALTPKGTPEHALLAKHVGKYQALHERQTAAAYKNALLREKHLNPASALAEEPIAGVLRGKKTAERIAARDIAFHGGDASAAFSPEGKALGRLSTGASGEKVRQRRLAATGAESRKAATNAALRDLDARLSKLGLKGQKRAEARLAALRTRQALRDRRNLGSLENAAKPKVKPPPETPNIFGLPNLSSRKLTHEIPKSTPVMQRIAELRDERARRGGAEFAPLLHALPTDTTKATGRVHRLADRAQKDAERKHAALLTAAKAHAEREARNEAVAKVEQGLEADRLYQGQVGMPSPLHERIFGPKVFEPPGLGEHVANFQKRAMFTNPLPHMGGNVLGQQVFAGGGLGTAAQGIGEAIKIARKDPEALKRLDLTKQHGATYEHGYEAHVPGENILAKGYRAIQRPLTISGEGQASALMQKYLREGMTPEDAAEEVRKTFGHPHESTKYSKAGKRFGVPFMKWVTETVPAAAKKMATSPLSRNALKQFARADYDVNSDIFEPEYGVEWHPGGFVERAADLVLKPGSYFSGPSVTPSMQEIGEESKRSAWDALKGYVPYSSLLEMGKQPLTPMQRARGGYKDLPAWAKAMQPFGSYFTKAETPRHILLRELKREGFTKPGP